MDYKKKYKEAFKRAKECHTDGLSLHQSVKDVIEYIFSELKEESEEENERIRKELLLFFTERAKYTEDSTFNGLSSKEIITWLEKQGKPTDINPSEFDLRLNKLLKQFESLPKEEIVSSLSFYLNVVRNDGTYREEKQNQFTVEQEQVLNKHVDNVLDKKPKFHEGEWITNGDYTWKILEATPLDYILQSQDGKTVGDTVSHVDEQFHLWTIDDAKDGDVLVDKSNGTIGIFKSIGHHIYGGSYNDTSYCFLHCRYKDGFFYANFESGNTIDTNNLIPAIKEQRYALERAMADAGWEFDFEKKELKKVEQSPADKVEPKFKVGNWYQCIKDFFGKGITFDKNTAYYCAKEGCLQDEYGCHIAIVKDLYDNFKLWTIQDAKTSDVLATENFIFIFKNIDNGNGVHYYCQYEIGKHENDNQFDVALAQSLMGRVGNSISHYSPATKEQCDLLFTKMHEAGYEWDAEKKELKKVEQSKLTEFEDAVKDMMNDYRDAIGDNDATTEEVKKHAEYLLSLIPYKPAEWSEEDERMCQNILECLRNGWRKLPTDILKYESWLKSLKPQPKQEWSEEDEVKRNELIGLVKEIKNQPLKRSEDWGGYISWLKSLRPQPKQEWRKEDEEIFGYLEDIVNFCYCNQYVVDVQTCERVRQLVFHLKSLCFQSGWSKDDITRINEIIETLNIVQANRVRTQRMHYNKATIDKNIDWLKSLKILPQPKQGWSEEDEKTLSSILYCIKHCQTEDIEAQYNGNRCVDPKRYEPMFVWLKSLRPQNK